MQVKVKQYYLYTKTTFHLMHSKISMNIIIWGFSNRGCIVHMAVCDSIQAIAMCMRHDTLQYPNVILTVHWYMLKLKTSSHSLYSLIMSYQCSDHNCHTTASPHSTTACTFSLMQLYMADINSQSTGAYA